MLHLGNGASASAVRGGVCFDTSMGLTPLAGLVMGSRTGDIDPAVIFHLRRVAGMSTDELDDLFNRRSGMLGMCGMSDMRDVHEAVAHGDEAARTALEVYYHRIQGYVGNYYAQLGHVDAIAFTAGIGENDDIVRLNSLAGLERLGIVGGPGAQRGPQEGDHRDLPRRRRGHRPRGAHQRGARDRPPVGRAARLTLRPAALAGSRVASPQGGHRSLGRVVFALAGGGRLASSMPDDRVRHRRDGRSS